MQKLKNNEPRPKFTGSHKKACNYFGDNIYDFWQILDYEAILLKLYLLMYIDIS